jgi:hypothetical protein
MGESKEVDNLIWGYGVELRVSAKRRKNIANYLTPPDGADLMVIREDYGDNLAVIPLDMLLDLAKGDEDGVPTEKLKQFADKIQKLAEKYEQSD